MPAGVIINSVQDFMAATLEIPDKAQRELVFLVPPSLFAIAATFNTVPKAKQFIQNGGVIRGVIPISGANIRGVRMRLDIGEDIRHSDEVHELYMFVGDRRYSVGAINVGTDPYTLDTPITAFWSEESTYAEYLLTSFEQAWSQAVPAKDRIEALLKQS